MKDIQSDSKGNNVEEEILNAVAESFNKAVYEEIDELPDDEILLA